MEVIQRVFHRLGLRLNEQKTRVVNARQESFDFLGFTFRMNVSRTTGNAYPHVQPSKKSLQKIKSYMTELTHRRRSILPLPLVMKRVNEVLIAWLEYFHYRNCSKQLEQLKGHVEQRVRTHLSSATRFAADGRGTSCIPIGSCTRSMDSSRCRRQLAGPGRMPCGEEHRKAVCGKTVCTV